jgi:hypothetical protein
VVNAKEDDVEGLGGEDGDDFDTSEDDSEDGWFEFGGVDDKANDDEDEWSDKDLGEIEEDDEEE